MAWVNPTGATSEDLGDADRVWNNCTNVINGLTTDWADTNPDAGEYSYYLYLTRAAIWVDKIQLYWEDKGSTGICPMDYYDGSWNQFNTIAGADHVWLERAFPAAALITQIRMKIWSNSNGAYARLAAVQWNEVSAPPSGSVSGPGASQMAFRIATGMV